MARFRQAVRLLRDIGSEIGIGDLSSAFSSSDPKSSQTVTLANVSGDALAGLHDWSQLMREYSFTTVEGQQTYDLPDDFSYMINQTGWVNGGIQPELPIAAADESAWAYLNAWDVGDATLWVVFKEYQGLLSLWPPPAGGIEISFTYQSSAWVKKDNGNYTDEVTEPDDVVLFPPPLFTRYLKYRWLAAKGFDSTAALADFNEQFSNWKSKNTPRPTVDMSGGGDDPELTIPFSGFGSGGG